MICSFKFRLILLDLPTYVHVHTKILITQSTVPYIVTALILCRSTCTVTFKYRKKTNPFDLFYFIFCIVFPQLKRFLSSIMYIFCIVSAVGELQPLYGHCTPWTQPNQLLCSLNDPKTHWRCSRKYGIQNACQTC